MELGPREEACGCLRRVRACLCVRARVCMYAGESGRLAPRTQYLILRDEEGSATGDEGIQMESSFRRRGQGLVVPEAVAEQGVVSFPGKSSRSAGEAGHPCCMGVALGPTLGAQRVTVGSLASGSETVTAPLEGLGETVLEGTV